MSDEWYAIVLVIITSASYFQEIVAGSLKVLCGISQLESVKVIRV